jgi:hypothetical protein
MAVPQWPLRVYFSPERELERKFARWDRWVQKGYLTQAKCKQLKEAMYRWYVTQLPSGATDVELHPRPTRPEADE